MSNLNILSVNNYGKICRTCLSKGELKDLYEKYAENICPAEMIMSISSMQIVENDGLPSQICANCEYKIIYAYHFVQKCTANEALLRTCLEEFETRIKEKDACKSREDDTIHLEILNKGCAPNLVQIVIIDPEENEITIEDDKIGNSLDILEIKDENDATIDCIDNNFDNSVSDSKIQLESNEINLGKTQKYECKKCSAVFPNYKLLQLHHKESKDPGHSYPRKICEICKKSINYSKMKQHMRVHTKEKPFCCEICGFRFNQTSSLRRHMICHTNDRPFKCNECDKSYTRKEFLKDHQRSHLGGSLFICNYCGKTYSQLNSFRSHLKYQHNRNGSEKCSNQIKSHKCSKCQRAFVTKAVLKTHMRTHGEKNFLCSDCGRSFVSKNILDSHSTIHTGLRPYSCKICGKSFAQLAGLSTHRVVHSELKAFACEICKRGFKLKTHLQRHQRTHSGERPFACSICGRSFALKENLTVHMRMHTGETPFLCSVCGKGFRDSSSMKKHRKRHGQQTEKDT